MPYRLTELQLALMDALWTLGEASVVDIHDAVRRERRVAQSTVATLLGRLEDKGVVTHRTLDRQYLYRALITRDEVRQSVVGELAGITDRLFSGDVASLVSQLLTTKDATPDDIARARAILDEKERELQARSRDAKRRKDGDRKR